MQGDLRTTEFDRQEFTNAYPPGVERNYWNLARNWIVERQLRSASLSGHLLKTSPILEIGCGSGIVVRYLRDRGWNVFGSELGNPTLMDGIEDLVWTSRSATDLDADFRHSVECILLLDVIEHIENDVDFLRNVLTAFPRCGCFIVTVPARQEAWSNFDEFYGHFRRYDRPMLSRAFRANDLAVKSQRYFFHTLYFAAMTLNLMRLTRRVQIAATERPMVDRIFAGILQLERLAVPPWIPGLSIIATATRPIL